MEYRALGRTGTKVSAICLGTMTFGQQNTEDEAHAQLDFALDQGINFVDAAEMYPVPGRVETYGKTEEFIGTWIKAHPAKRQKITLATKAVASGRGFDWIRGGNHPADRANLVAAVDASLQRLKTDRIDLYQLHWPDRKTNMFGELGYSHDPQDNSVPIAETLRVLDDMVRAGKIRFIGLSNETPWGVAQFLNHAERHNLARVVSIQNPYNLLNRSYEIGLAEMSIREECGLLAYSPLAMGVLTGKYLNGAKPAGARLTLFDRFQRYNKPQGTAAAARYIAVAKDHSLDPAVMAIAYILRQPFVTSVIIGATTLAQLKQDITAQDQSLSEAVVKAIEAVHTEIPNPCP